ncbi:MAG: hypothetical protein JNM88_05730 [Chitinophagaceae bacterium]|nr:hypothetical protein [Chitinophagaceae bacterium]
MKKITSLLLFAGFLTIAGQAQSDKRLTERLDSVMLFTQKLDIDRLLDFTYPKLFTIAPRNAMKEVMEGSFHTDEFDITLDSVITDVVFPIFTSGDGKYAKVLHNMLLRMKFKEEMSGERTEELLSTMKENMGTPDIRFEKATNTIVIRKLATIVAVKDELSPEWTFVNYDETSPVAEMLFSAEIIEKLREYKK